MLYLGRLSRMKRNDYTSTTGLLDNHFLESCQGHELCERKVDLPQKDLLVEVIINL